MKTVSFLQKNLKWSAHKNFFDNLLAPAVEEKILVRQLQDLSERYFPRRKCVETAYTEFCLNRLFLKKARTPEQLWVTDRLAGQWEKFCLIKEKLQGVPLPADEKSTRIEQIAAEEGAEAMVIAAKTEEDIASLETYEDKQLFLDELGLEESGVNRLIKKAYALLNLETFITAGEMEVKAWTYKRGWKAPQCAGVIHTDFEKGFIRAEVIKYDDYIKYGSEAAVREAGKMGIEGKDYVVQDGDIMHFRFNV